MLDILYQYSTRVNSRYSTTGTREGGRRVANYSDSTALLFITISVHALCYIFYAVGVSLFGGGIFNLCNKL